MTVGELVDFNTALVTGGYGFIGSNVATELARQGVSVRVLDSFLEGCGANRANLDESNPNLETLQGDVRDSEVVDHAISDVDVVFHLAAQLSRPRSLEDPAMDVEINCLGTITILEALRAENPNAQVVFAGSQAEFGIPETLPLSEDVPERPVDVYGTNKLAAEHYCSVYDTVHGIDATTLRFSNVYGPKANLRNVNYGVINKFIRLAFEGEELTVFRPGTMKRDPIFIDDVVRALVAAANRPADDLSRDSYVIGSGEPASVHELAERIVAAVGSGTVELVEWPEDWDSIRVGDLYMDPTAAREELDWEPTVSLKEGLSRTVSFYRNHREAYLGG